MSAAGTQAILKPHTTAPAPPNKASSRKNTNGSIATKATGDREAMSLLSKHKTLTPTEALDIRHEYAEKIAQNLMGKIEE